MKTETNKLDSTVERFHYVDQKGNMYAPPEYVFALEGDDSKEKVQNAITQALTRYLEAGLKEAEAHCYITSREDGRESILIIQGPAELVLEPMPASSFA